MKLLIKWPSLLIFLGVSPQELCQCYQRRKSMAIQRYFQRVSKFGFHYYLRGSARQNPLIFNYFCLYLKWSCMCVETCVKISDESDKKWRSYRLIAYESWVVRRDRLYSDWISSQRVGRVGEVVLVQIIIFSLEDAQCYSYLLSCHVLSRADW